MRALFVVFAVLCTVTAAYHAVGIFVPVNEASPARHAVFIAVNIACGIGFLKRPRWFVWLFGALVLQQLHSHGGHLLAVWRTEHRVHAIDLGMVIAMPALLACLIIDARTTKEKGPQLGPSSSAN